MKGYSSREIIGLMIADGWFLVDTRKDLPGKTIDNILNQAQLK